MGRARQSSFLTTVRQGVITGQAGVPGQILYRAVVFFRKGSGDLLTFALQ
jgi:hypothetical protein